MSFLTSIWFALACTTLAFFGPLFSFGEPGAPPIRLGSDAQPLSTAFDCVNVISGNYFIAEPNLTIDGVAPLSFTLAYDGGNRNDTGLAWGWHIQIPWRQGYFSWAKKGMHKHFQFTAEESENANICYENLSDPGSVIPFQVSNDVYDLVGYTNVSGGSISGQTNLHKNRAIYWSWGRNYEWGSFSITTGSGSSRWYEVYKFDGRQQWRIYKEILPSGCEVRYSYCGPHKLSRIWTTTPSGLVLNSIDFLYDAVGCFAHANTGQSVRYHTGRVHAKRDYHNGYGLDTKLTHMREIIPSDGAPSAHRLCMDHVDSSWLKQDRREWRNGRFLDIIYRKTDGKVQALHAPLGSNNTPIALACFDYGKNFTVVADALGSKTVYRYSQENRITAIEKCHLNGQVRAKNLFVWDTSPAGKGNLLATAVTDAQSLACSSTVFSYDKAGNVTQEWLYGNLSGRCPELFSMRDDLRTNSMAEHNKTSYTYSSDGRNLRLSEKHDNGRVIRYAYKPGSNLLVSKLTGDEQRTLSREFHEYDANHFLVKTIVDDGTGSSSDQLQDVTVRTIKIIKPRNQSPAIGFPDQIVHQYWDPQTHVEHQLRRIQYTYNAGDQVIQEDIYDAEDRFQYALTYAYDERRNLIAQSDALGRVTQFTYDINNNKLSEEFVDVGIRTHFRYDLMNRLIAKEEMHVDGTCLVTNYKYDYMGNKVAEIDPFGNETRFVYDEFGRLIETFLPLQEVLDGSVRPLKKQSYNAFDHCVSQTDALGHVTKMRYNCRNQPISVLNPDGTQERYEYYVDGSLEKYWNAQGLLTQYTYDVLGRLLKKAEYDTNGNHLTTTSYEYTGSQLTHEIDPLGVVTEYGYDGAGRKCRQICAGARTEYGYDSLGRQSHTKSWFGSGEGDYTVTIQEFDLVNRLIEERIEDAFGRLLHKKAYQYDIQDNRTHEFLYCSETEFSVNEVRYNTRKQPIEIIDARGAKTHITYDLDHCNALGQRVLLKTTTDPLGQQVADVHDAYGRVVASTTHDSFRNQLAGYRQVYDPVGNLVQRIDDVWVNGELQSQRITASYYDAGKRITHLCEAFGTSDQRSTRFSYNQCGQLETLSLPGDVSLHPTYDAFGHLQTYRASDGSFDYRYDYDAVGNVIKVTDQINNTVTTRAYDAHHKITSETLGNGLALQYTYDNQGRCIVLRLPDGSAIHWIYEGRSIKEIHRLNKEKRLFSHLYVDRNLIGNVLEMSLPGQAGTISYRYDSLQRPISIASPAYQEQIPEDGYDDAGNLLKHHVADASGSRELRYAYDGLYQLIREEGAVSQRYTYDSLYNRISKGNDKYTANAVQSLLRAGKTSFVNDARGNPIESSADGALTRYHYDALGRLTRIEKGCFSEEYRYDSFNRRLSAHRYKKDRTGNWILDSTRHFLYTDQNEIGAANADGKIIQLRVLGDGRGAEISAAVALELDGRCYAPIHDLRGNCVALLDSCGKVVENMHYSAFGEELSPPRGASSIRCPWRFSSKRLDEVTGLTCFGRRYYDSALGRWLTPDPIGYKAGPNLYAYVHNSPLTHFDLYGLYTRENNPYRDSNYTTAGPVGRGVYNSLFDPWGTACRWGGYACDLSSAVWNRDFSQISQNYSQLREGGRLNFCAERIGEIVGVGGLVYAGAATGATKAASTGSAALRWASLGARAGARWAYNRWTATGEVSTEAQAAPQIARPQDVATQASGKIWNYTRNETSVQKAYRHWKDHGHEFPECQNAKQYVEATRNFLNNPPRTALSRIRAKDGAFIVYDAKTQAFAVRGPNGLPRTMYKPDPRIHEYENNLEYFYGQ